MRASVRQRPASDEDSVAAAGLGQAVSPERPPARATLSRRRLLAVGAGTGAALTVAGAASGPSAAAAAATCERRYLQYRDADRAKPYAKYMKPRVDPPQPHVPAAIQRGPIPSAQVPARTTLAQQVTGPWAGDLETAYGRTSRGEIWVACHTDMPRVQPEMWDWWFGWHSKESARYKLWHPEAHAYAALRRDTTDALGLTDRERYRGNTSYVDEIIGGKLDQLAITFTSPARFGIDDTTLDGTVICGLVGSAYLPVNIGLVCHAVRRTPAGAEMRSRFYLNVPGIRSVDASAVSCAISRGLVPPSQIVFPLQFGAALLRHCGEEMNHLAQFLPELYAEFS